MLVNKNDIKVLFVVPKFIEKKKEYYEFPLGILYIATVLKDAGYIVDILDMNLYPEEDNNEIIVKYLQKNSVNVVMTGGLSAFYFSIEEIIQSVKQYDSNIYTVLGGGIVTSDKELICNEINPDFAILGEAELTIVHFMDVLYSNKLFKNVLGLGYKEALKWYFNAQREALDDIDTIPYPDFNMIDVEEYFSRQTPTSSNYLYPLDFPRALPIITSRSCPLNCTFCFHPIGQKYRKKSLDNVFHEIETMIEKYKMNILVVMDEMMSASPNRLIEFSKRIKKYNILWTCQLWTSSVDESSLKLMRESGCYLISFGLESINQDVLLSMKKFGINKKNIEKSLELAKENNITIQGNFIFGDPAETLETANETLQWWKEHPDYNISLGRVAPYPGTPLYKYAIEKGIITDCVKFIKDGTPSINMTSMTQKEYSQLSSKIAQYSAEVRNYCNIISISVDARTEDESYLCSLECPHCHKVTDYGNIYIQKPTIFKLACRSCALRFDVNPSKFPNIQKLLLKQKDILLNLQKEHSSFVISPAIAENICIEYFDLVGINYNDLNIKYAIDSTKTKVGSLYLDKYEVIQRDVLLLDEWKDSAVIILPSLYRQDIIKEFKSLGFDDERIFSVELS